MPSGRLATADISAGVNTVLFTCEGGRSRDVTINVANRNDKDVEINIALCERDVIVPSDDDYIEYETVLRPKGVLERTEISLAGYQSLIVYSSKSKVSFSLWS